jgi:rubrerythrin
MSLAEKISDVGTFLTYSVTLEEEAAERHDELADMMDAHNNPEVAETFRKLAHYSRLHAREIRDRSAGHKLPVIAPWDFAWENMEGPETADISGVHYLMTATQALRIAMGNEQRAHDFYSEISRHSPAEAVRVLAAEFAAEEKEHLGLLEKWLAKYPESDEQAPFDPDPAHMPE